MGAHGQIVAELDEVLGEGEVPKTSEDIRSLKYLHHVINETLRCVPQARRRPKAPLVALTVRRAAHAGPPPCLPRLWAVVPRVLRCAREDDVLPSGYRIKAGVGPQSARSVGTFRRKC